MLPFNPEVVAPRERFEAWSDFLDRTLMPLRIEPVGEHPFHVRMEARVVGELPLVSVAGAGGNVARGRSEIARSSEHFHIISMHLGGVASLTVRGRERHLARGDLFLIDTMHELRFGLERPYQHLLLKVPKEWLAARLPRPDLLFGSVLSHQRIFASHGETVMQHLLKQRIRRATKLLGSPRARHRSITEVALACGFNDLTHFGRTFSEQMGMTPSQWRCLSG